MEKVRIFRNPLGDGYRACQLCVGQVTNRRSPHDRIPADSDCVIETDTHEAMIQPDRPTMHGCHIRQDMTGQRVPLVEQGPAWLGCIVVARICAGETPLPNRHHQA